MTGLMKMSEDAQQNLRLLAEKLDSEGMLGHLRNFPNDLCAALSGSAGTLDMSQREWKGVLCLGMGGSAAAGDFLATLCEEAKSGPVITWRDYSLPGWWDVDWLVIATSYSGNTEETLDGAKQVLAAGGTLIAICSGGELEELCAASENAHLVTVPGGQPPRSAFGHLFGAQLAVAAAVGLVTAPNEEDLSEITKRLSAVLKECDFITTSDSFVVEIAGSLLTREAGIIAAPELAAAAIRFCNQLNENSGVFAAAGILPEMNHNEVVAWADSAANGQKRLLLMTWSGQHERVTTRIKWMTSALDVGAGWGIECEGISLLESLLYACVVMDWASCALALLRGKDPSAIGPISSLKDHLSA
jgi:glucose/mannose-6-phosphate isomerase